MKIVRAFTGIQSVSVNEESLLELRPKATVHTIRISSNRRGNAVAPQEPCHDPVRLIREPLKTLAAPTPPDDERISYDFLLLERVDVARATCGLFAAEVLLECRY